MRLTRIKLTEEEQARREQYHKNLLWHDTHLKELRAKYAGCWVGIYEERVVGVSSDFGMLMHELDSGGYPRGEILSVQVTPAPGDTTHTARKSEKASTVGRDKSTNGSLGTLGTLPSKEDHERAAQYRIDELWFKVHLSDLRAKYPNQWVGIHQQKIAGASPDPDDLMRAMKSKGYPLGEVFCDFVHAKPMNWDFTFDR